MVMQPAEDPTDDTYPHTYEHSLDRVACALGGAAVLPPAFSFIPAMLASHDWRLRHAGLMAIAAIAEGTSKVMQNELGKVIECVCGFLPALSPDYGPLTSRELRMQPSHSNV